MPVADIGEAPAATKPPPDRALRGHDHVGKAADENHAKAGIGVGAQIVLVFLSEGRIFRVVGITGEGVASRRCQRKHGEGEPREADQAAKGRAGEPDQVARSQVERIADHAAEPGRQGPAVRGRQRAGHRSGGDGAHQPKRQAQREAAERARPHQLQRPCEWRQQDRNDTEAEQLHQHVRDDGAGFAHEVADKAIGRVVEAGIINRPAGQCGHQHDDQRDQGKARHLGGAAAGESPQGRWKMIDQGVASDHAHGIIGSRLSSRSRQQGRLRHRWRTLPDNRKLWVKARLTLWLVGGLPRTKNPGTVRCRGSRCAE